eukprot:TRINITY_DN4256_c0_g1_i1.p1 TRINITY_DN4256_c0_g1~~TRINITY_DN4256_c0_g1_i1.p1  ORF type:complete len:207 (-),score=37.34 TRINITY_DN4256_c0_g1_i1:297-917(-)
MWKEKEIFNGDIGVILGLFEELHKSYDSAVCNNGLNQPYTGLYGWKVMSREEMDARTFSELSKENSVQEDGENYLSSLEIPLITSERVPIIRQAVLGENELIRNMDPKMTVNSFNIHRAETTHPTHKEFTTTRKNVEPYRDSDLSNFKTPSVKCCAVKTLSNKSLEQWIKNVIEVPSDFSLFDNSKNHFKDGYEFSYSVGLYYASW